MTPIKLSRRAVLKSGAAAGGLLAAGTIVVGCGNDVSPAPVADFDVPLNFKIVVELSRYPDLDPPGKHVGAITMRLRYLDGSGAMRIGTLLLAQWSQGRFLATQSECPHKGCPLGFSTSARLIECPCHGSRFAVDTIQSGDFKTTWCAGDVVHRPAKSGLARFKVDAQVGIVTVDVSDTARLDGNVETTPCTSLDVPLPVVNGKVVLAFADFPDLTRPGGQVIGVPMVTPAINPILVVRVDATSALSIDALCNHKGCPIQFAQANRDYECPCHGSIYAVDGSVVRGPSDRPLHAYAAVVGATAITVTLA